MRNVIITGVSRGLGAALFDQLHARGDRILAIGRRFTATQVAAASGAATQAAAASGAATQTAAASEAAGRVTLMTADLADPGQLPDADTLRRFITGDAPPVLIHNAGVVEPIGTVGALDPDAVTRAVAVNLTAPLLLTNALLQVAPGATILFISSGAARRVIEGWSTYCATKAGGEMFFNAVAAEHPDATVVNVNPGVMDTGMQEAIRGADFPDHGRFVKRYEQGELADPADVAARIIAEHLS